jgi:hypothetical protein
LIEGVVNSQNYTNSSTELLHDDFVFNHTAEGNMTNGTDSYDDWDGPTPFTVEWYADWCETKMWLFDAYDVDDDEVLTRKDAIKD